MFRSKDVPDQMKLFGELKRRNVFRVAAAYVVLGWVVIQVTDTVSPALHLPDWTLTFITWIGIVGFPFALVFAWAFELTPEGVRRESNGGQGEAPSARTNSVLDMVLVILLAIAIGIFAWDFLSRDTETLPFAEADGERVGTGEPGAPIPASDSIAVLPLSNMSEVAGNEFFAGGVHEEILTNLTRVDDLRVISRTTMLRYLNSDRSVREIGRELDVHYVVEGSVRRIGDHVRITIQLVDALQDAHLWARNYDRKLVDVFGTQTEVAREIARSLQLEIIPDSVDFLEAMPTDSVKAYDLFMKADSIHRGEPMSEDNYLRQRAFLEAAVAEDPNFVEAWARLNDHLDEMARTIKQDNWFGETESERDEAFAENRELAAYALDRAVALDPDNVATLMAQGTNAIAEFRDPVFRSSRIQYLNRALELDPDNAWIWYALGWWGWDNGDIEKGTESMHRALELDPLHAHIVGGSLAYFRLTGDEDMTARLAERYAQIAPEQMADGLQARVPSTVKLNNIYRLLLETADPEMIGELAKTFAAESADFVPVAPGQGRENLLFWRVMLISLQRDREALFELASEGGLPDGGTGQLAGDLGVLNILLAGQIAEGLTEEAAVTARRILDMREDYDDDLLIEGSFVPDLMTHRALAVLGEEEQLRALGAKIVTAPGRIESPWNAWVYVAYAHVDLDAAVEMLLEQKAAHPRWIGTDDLALNVLRARDIVTHPDMQAFYTAEGKWVDYLAARVPEYRVSVE